MPEIDRKNARSDAQKPASERESLLKREAELQERLAAIARDIGSRLDADSEERAVQLENREVLEEIARVTRLELERVRKLIADWDAGIPEPMGNRTRSR